MFVDSDKAFVVGDKFQVDSFKGASVGYYKMLFVLVPGFRSVSETFVKQGNITVLPFLWLKGECTLQRVW